MRLAVDTTVSKAVLAALAVGGHEVVLRRGPEEPAALWLERVFASDADAAVSAASWVGRRVWQGGLYFVRVPGGVKGPEQVEPVLKTLARCVRRG